MFHKQTTVKAFLTAQNRECKSLAVLIRMLFVSAMPFLLSVDPVEFLRSQPQRCNYYLLDITARLRTASNIQVEITTFPTGEINGNDDE